MGYLDKLHHGRSNGKLKYWCIQQAKFLQLTNLLLLKYKPAIYGLARTYRIRYKSLPGILHQRIFRQYTYPLAGLRQLT